MSEDSIANRILKSSFWQYLGSWIDKIIGFISTIILARILVPDDFGVVAAASIITGLFHVIASVGTDQYLIRKSEVSYTQFNTGWTINIIMKSISAIAVFLLAVPISSFMGDARLILVLQIVSISAFLSGFNNIGLVLFEREYNYKPKFIIGLTSRIIGFAAKVSLAIYLHNYWAFIIAELVETTVFLIGSFVLHKYRPKLSLNGWKQQWMFSQWILLKSIFVFLRFRIDNIFISKFLPLDSLGFYTVAKDVATLPSGQIIGPIMQPLYVGLSSMHDKPILFADKVHKSLSLLFIVVLPISLGTYATADNLVYVLLGNKWELASPIVMILSFILIPGTLGDFLTGVMTAMGNVKLIFKFEVLFSLLALGSFALLAKSMSLYDFALLRVILTTLSTFFMLFALTNLSKLSMSRILGLIILPLLASIFMVFVVVKLNAYIILYSHLIQLGVQILIGAISYLTIITLCIFLFKSRVNEYQFIWKTFYSPIFFML